MTHATGWILDVSVEKDRATILVKTTEGNILKLLDTYKPNFYILSKDEKGGADLFQILTQENMVEKIEWEHKFIDLFEPILKNLISVYTKSIVVHNTLVKKLEKDTRVEQLFNTDMFHVQQYLFNTLKIEPTRKVGVEYKEDNARLWRITKINEYEVVLPSFSILYIDGHVRARYQAEPEVHLEGDEEFQDYVISKDPDIIVSTTVQASPLKDRVLLHNKSFYDDLDLAGLIEVARFGFLPLSLAARYGMNRLIESRNCYTLIQRGFVFPSRDANMNHEPIRTLEEINSKDKGGMIFSPRVGLHENVVVLDYENEYANLILKHYEASEEKGLLPTVLAKVLRRRIFFKNLQKSFHVDTTEWIWCEQRINTLKSILVSLYGTSGSFWNRFANVETFEEINRLSREILIKTKT